LSSKEVAAKKGRKGRERKIAARGFITKVSGGVAHKTETNILIRNKADKKTSNLEHEKQRKKAGKVGGQEKIRYGNREKRAQGPLALINRAEREAL